ncbi:MAG: hypothetical protein HY791_30290 [Deltaproteobacteria bacterium]|nr:hypothetical protein [Deltaproteobacteria bacterium]
MQLAPTAMKLYRQIVADKPDLKAKVDQAMGSAPVATQLTADKLTQLLVAAMPEQKSMFEQLNSNCLCHHPDKTNGKFVSTIASLLIEKERNAVYTAPAVTRPARDPLHAEIIIGKDSDFVILANGAVFDQQRRPLAMKVIARERADVAQIKKALAEFHTQWGDQADIVKVANNAAYHKLADQQEGEFRFGDPVAVVSFDGKAKEQGRTGMARPQNRQVIHLFHPKVENGVHVPDTTRPVGAPQVATGPQLDNAPVQVFKETVHFSLTPKANMTRTAGAWLDERLSVFDAKMSIDEGLLLQPDAHAKATCLNSSMVTQVPETDFSFAGSPAASSPVDLGQHQAWTLQNLISQPVRVLVRSNATTTDQATHDFPIQSLLYPNAADLQVGKAAMSPFSDTSCPLAKRAELGIDVALEPLADDAEKDGAAVHVRLPKGLFSAKGEGSMAGYSVEIGINDLKGWQGSEAVKLEKSSSGELCFELTLPNLTGAINRNLEIRLRNENGLPATRLLVPMKDVTWGE